MKVVIFAGGVGSRLWPLSRKNTPKQFEKIVGDKSMLQIAVQKLVPPFKWEDIYISTGKQYEDIVREQLPKLPEENIIVEPEMRDVGPAVGLITSLFVKTHPTEPVVFLWGSDHLVKKEDVFQQALKAAEEIINNDPQRIVFIGQKPRFGNQNLGYLEFGKEVNKIGEMIVNEFKCLQYRPHLSVAEKYFKDGKHAWNLGYYVTTPQFVWKLFEEFAPEIFSKLQKIHDAYQTKDYEKVLQEEYPTMEKISFDNAILEKMNPSQGYVISADIGWSDIGAWEAMKEALSETTKDNVTKGKVVLEDSLDTLAFNYENKLVVGIDLKELLVINTQDVLLVCPKTSVPKIKKFVESLKGTKFEELT